MVVLTQTQTCFFEVGRRSNLLPLTPLSAILPPLLLLCFFFTATAAAVLLFLRRPAVATGSSSSPLHLLLRRCCCWCFFFFSTSSSSSFVQYGFDDSYIYIYIKYIFFVYGFDDFFVFLFFGIMGIMIHICLMCLESKFLYMGLMSLDLNLG